MCASVTDAPMHHSLNERNHMRKKYFFILAGLFLLLSLYFFMAVFSSVDLNFANCNNVFSWDSPLWRCRQPVYFEIATGFTFMIAAIFFGCGVWKALRSKKDRKF